MIFYKTVSAGNDFIHINRDELSSGQIESLADLARKLCARKSGIGCDGLIIYQIEPKSIQFRIFNQDGSEAELSGNGMAGLASLMFFLGKSEKGIDLKTISGNKQIKLLKREGNRFNLMVEIGNPDFDNRAFFPFLEEEKLEYSYKNERFYPLSVGNPHIVILLSDKIPNDELAHRGSMLENASIFPQRTNVEFVLFKNENQCSVYFYERGVGCTQSSSTGSAAVFAVLQRLNQINNRLCIQTGENTAIISGKDMIFIENSTKIMYKGICLT